MGQITPQQENIGAMLLQQPRGFWGHTLILIATMLLSKMM